MGRKLLPTRLPFARARAPSNWRATYLRPKLIVAADRLSQHTPAQLRQGFQTAIGTSGSNASSLALQLAPQQHDAFLLSHLHTLVQQLTHGPSTVKCWVDYTLFRQPLRVSASHRVLLAANMHNNEELLPHYLAQLIHVLSLLPPGSAFLSIYESGSTDATGAWCTGLPADAKKLCLLCADPACGSQPSGFRS